MKPGRHRLSPKFIAVSCSFLALAACDVLNDNEPMDVDTAVVSNPPLPPNGVQQGRPFVPSFVGWQFGGTFDCDENGQPVMVQIWEGVEDPCFEIIPEGARVVVLEFSDVRAGPFNFGETCSGPRSAGAIFGEVQGGMMFTSRASQGASSLQGLDVNNVLQGTFSAQFRNSVGFTSGGFRVAPHCLQFPFPSTQTNGTGGNNGTNGGNNGTNGDDGTTGGGLIP